MIGPRAVHAAGLLRSDVGQRAFQRVRMPRLLGLERHVHGNPEVDQADPSGRHVKDDVVRGDVAVRNPPTMEFGERFAEPTGRRQECLQVNLARIDDVSKRFPADILDDQRRWRVFLEGQRLDDALDLRLPSGSPIHA